jgi:HTH-type transcriptional regulator/antitoxin HigA
MGTTRYEDLLREIRPEVIETGERYDEVSQRLAELVRKGKRRTSSDTRLMKLLAVLVEDYDRRHSLPPDDGSPADKLRHLLEMSGKSPAELAPVFGQRSHVNEALTGKRPISAEQARKLGTLFSVRPGLFV